MHVQVNFKDLEVCNQNNTMKSMAATWEQTSPHLKKDSDIVIKNKITLISTLINYYYSIIIHS